MLPTLSQTRRYCKRDATDDDHRNRRRFDVNTNSYNRYQRLRVILPSPIVVTTLFVLAVYFFNSDTTRYSISSTTDTTVVVVTAFTATRTTLSSSSTQSLSHCHHRHSYHCHHSRQPKQHQRKWKNKNNPRIQIHIPSTTTCTTTKTNCKVTTTTMPLYMSLSSNHENEPPRPSTTSMTSTTITNSTTTTTMIEQLDQQSLQQQEQQTQYIGSMEPYIQQITFLSSFIALGIGTKICITIWYTILQPLLGTSYFTNIQTTIFPIVFGTIFTLVGIAHFVFVTNFARIVPPYNTWGGLWKIPAPLSQQLNVSYEEYHSYWTGIVEFLGGLWLFYTGIHPPSPDDAITISLFTSSIISITNVPAALLFLLTIAVTPANIYMFTHNASPGGMVPQLQYPYGHLARFLLQCGLLSNFYIMMMVQQQVPSLLSS